jgi:dTDP-4-amino-4,6-dideoxygalactose transaminase
MDQYKIPFNRAVPIGTEFDYIQKAIDSWYISGDGSFTQRCQTFLEQELGVKRAMLCTSCTHALELAALLIDLEPGDEVILPSFTFVSTANAFVLRGARPVFCDIRPDTLNMDERQVERLITPRTRAIVCVHYAGVGCEMADLQAIAQRHGLVLIEDNAHGLFGSYEGRYLGTFGAMATQSFHETKNFTCGEGGALLINDPKYIERAEIIREKGTNRKRFFRGEVDKYTWVDRGSSYLPSDILAAFLYAQFEAHRQVQAKRRQVWDYYARHLREWATTYGVRFPIVPSHCQQSYHMFYVLLPSQEVRQALIGHLKSASISSVFHYQPLHLSEMGRLFGGQPGDCPVTEDVSERLLRLPFYNDLSKTDQDYVIEAILAFQLECVTR